MSIWADTLAASTSAGDASVFAPSGSRMYATNVLLINGGPNTAYITVGSTTITASTSESFPLASAESLSIALTDSRRNMGGDRRAMECAKCVVSTSSSGQTCSVRILATDF